ncbi:unnamed protein product [Lymnaea stagnalis]|uniref:Uncharacterized protein n=1 Tax=Lymnaea stagnalis TaxID=6523 RepID=A0AAV2I3G5_LYMST
MEDMRSALKQVMSENSHEKFDERRINLIKLQIIQLERQIAILGDALGSRQESIYEVENVMAWSADKLRSLMTSNTKGLILSGVHGDMTQIVESLESARIKLFKSLENSGKEAVGKELIFLNPFLGGKFRQEEPLTLLDISLKRLEYVNLRHVSELESKMCRLYKELIRVHDVVEGLKNGRMYSGNVSTSEKNRTETILLKSCVLIKDVADELLSLSLLCPSAPLPGLKRPLADQVPIERVKAALPNLPRSKHDEVHHVIESSIHVCNHRQLLMEKEKTVLKEELAFHRSVYDIQLQYTQNLFDAVRKGYDEFETSVRSVICQPIKKMLLSYSKLKNSASEEALKGFLISIKENENQLQSIVDMMDNLDFDTDDSGAKAFSRFGEEFFAKINNLSHKCQQKRENALQEKREVKEEQTRIDRELQQLIQELEIKYEKQWVPKSHKKASNWNIPDINFFSNVQHGQDTVVGDSESGPQCKDGQSSGNILQHLNFSNNSLWNILNVNDFTHKSRNQTVTSSRDETHRHLTRSSSDLYIGSQLVDLHKSEDVEDSELYMKKTPINISPTVADTTLQEKPVAGKKRHGVKSQKVHVPLVAMRTLKLKRSESLSNMINPETHNNFDGGTDTQRRTSSEQTSQLTPAQKRSSWR